MERTVITVERQSVSLAELAAQIDAAHRRVETAVKDTLTHAKQAGELLIRAKSQLPHGNFQPWIRANCQATPRMVQHYMRVAKRWDMIKEMASLRGALKLLGNLKNETRVSHLAGKLKAVDQSADSLAYYQQVIADAEKAAGSILAALKKGEIDTDFEAHRRTFGRALAKMQGVVDESKNMCRDGAIRLLAALVDGCPRIKAKVAEIEVRSAVRVGELLKSIEKNTRAEGIGRSAFRQEMLG